MSRKATEFQKKEMSRMYRGKEIFKPLNTGWIDEHVACVREWVANIFFYRKGDTTIMIDAGYNYDRLEEKMGWLGIDPKSIRHILITHQDTDHVGAVEADSPGLFRGATLYVGEIEDRYLTGEVRRRVIYHLYKLPQVTINDQKVLLKDGQVFDIDGIRIECFLVPGHTWGHMVYLIDNKYLLAGGARLLRRRAIRPELPGRPPGHGPPAVSGHQEPVLVPWADAEEDPVVRWPGHPPLFHCGGQGPDLPQSPPPTGRQSGGQALSAPIAAVAGARLVCFRQQRGAPQIPQRRPQRLPLRPLSGI